MKKNLLYSIFGILIVSILMSYSSGLSITINSKYPNLSTATIYLQLEGTKSKNGSLQVFNSTGSLVADLTKSLDKTTDFQLISMENNAVASGICYIVWKNNEKVETRKYAIYK